MSESVVVNAGANAPWQVHRFSSALLKAPVGQGGVGWRRGPVEQLPVRSPRSAEGDYLKTRQSAGWRRGGWRWAAKPIRWGRRSLRGGDGG